MAYLRLKVNQNSVVHNIEATVLYCINVGYKGTKTTVTNDAVFLSFSLKLQLDEKLVGTSNNPRSSKFPVGANKGVVVWT